MAGVSRRHMKKKNRKMFKNINIMQFGDDIQNQHEKYIEISTIMPSIGFKIPDIK